MAAASIRVEGLNKVVRDLQSMGLEVEDLKDAMGNIAEQGARLASSFAPKQTGRLAADIRGNRAKAKAVVTAGRVAVPYAGPINYGWPARNIAASGFLQKADEAVQPYALQQLEREINEAIRKRGLA